MRRTLGLAIAIGVLALTRAHGQTVATPASNPERLIQNVLTEYVSALEQKNFEAIKRIWPTMTPAQIRAIRAEFDHARALRCELTEPRITVKEDAAVVIARRKYTLTTHEGKSFESTSITTFNMKRSASGWVIDSIRYDL